ncbi:unnamed protein product [Citrullus colocynthis]|uniref:Uncharacterized protein n=1 Tax=Citrullus colocynthis TaxID=252529 RepID=A0ABP0YYK0_9ROSI
MPPKNPPIYDISKQDFSILHVDATCKVRTVASDFDGITGSISRSMMTSFKPSLEFNLISRFSFEALDC